MTRTEKRYLVHKLDKLLKLVWFAYNETNIMDVANDYLEKAILEIKTMKEEVFSCKED